MTHPLSLQFLVCFLFVFCEKQIGYNNIDVLLHYSHLHSLNMIYGTYIFCPTLSKVFSSQTVGPKVEVYCFKGLIHPNHL